MDKIEQNLISEFCGIVKVDPVHKIEIPAPNKWWDYELEVEMEERREAEKLENISEKKEESE